MGAREQPGVSIEVPSALKPLKELQVIVMRTLDPANLVCHGWRGEGRAGDESVDSASG